MSDVFPPAHIETAQLLIPAKSSGTANAAVTGPVVSIVLQPNTITFIFGAIQDAAVNEQKVLAQLLGTGITAEQSVILDGKKDNAYHVESDKSEHAVVWGPFAELKKIQIALYWINSSGNGLQPIDEGEIKEFEDKKLRTKVTLIPVFREKDNTPTLRTVVNVTRMTVKATEQETTPPVKKTDAEIIFFRKDSKEVRQYDENNQPKDQKDILIEVPPLHKAFEGATIRDKDMHILNEPIQGTLSYCDVKDLTGTYKYHLTTYERSDGVVHIWVFGYEPQGNGTRCFMFFSAGRFNENFGDRGCIGALGNGFNGIGTWRDTLDSLQLGPQ
ncbi:hypothetical protein BYT27DRAFT_7299223 [Phlegmacium glaucopus]|nr:hypothetical protein BYT27DRAFT_7299223 [Phlegmacium glaucopus]